MSEFSIKPVPFSTGYIGREVTYTFGGTEMPEMTPPAHINQRCTMTPMESTQMNQDDELKYQRKICELEMKLSAATLNNALAMKITPNKYAELNRFVNLYKTGSPASVILTHGKAYTFDYGETKDVLGVYSISGKSFMGFTKSVNIYRSIDCTNIRPMAVVETLKGNANEKI